MLNYGGGGNDYQVFFLNVPYFSKKDNVFI